MEVGYGAQRMRLDARQLEMAEAEIAQLKSEIYSLEREIDDRFQRIRALMEVGATQELP